MSRRRPWSSASIRRRLLVGLLGVLAAGMLASGASSTLLLRGFLDERSAASLRGAAERVAAVAARGPQTADADQLSALLGPPLGVVVVTGQGTVATSTGAAQQAPEELVRVTAASAGRMVPYDAEGVSSLIAVRVDTPGLLVTEEGESDVEAAALVLVTDTSVDDATEARLLLIQALLTAVFMAVLGALSLVVLGVGLRPLHRLAATADAIAAGSLDQRLPLEGRPTETDGLARAVNRAFDAQARAEATARSFAADASHELRTPLATITGWLDLYHQGVLSGDAVGEAVGHIDTEVGRMRLMVEELGLLARLDSGRPLERADVDLVSLAASVMEDARVVDPDRRITMEATEPVHVVGDAQRLTQVLRNLVGNAVQHTPLGTAVTLAVDDVGARARVTVHDDGPGISAENLPRVFDRFWRAEASRSRSYGGSGLGLAIVEAIIHAHGGSVGVRSSTTEGSSGTTVTVELPGATAGPARTDQ